MRLCCFVAVVIWAGTVTAISESDSHGNWSNEKEPPAYGFIYEIQGDVKPRETRDDVKPSKLENGNENQPSADVTEKREAVDSSSNDKSHRGERETDRDKNATKADSHRRYPLQIIQPYVLNLETKLAVQIDTRNTSVDHLPDVKTTNDTLTVEFIPSQEVVYDAQATGTTPKYVPLHDNDTDDPGYVSDDDVEPDIGNFGQRVRPQSPRDKIAEGPGRFRSKIHPDNAQVFPSDEPGEHKKLRRTKIFRLRSPLILKRLNTSESGNEAKNPQEDVYRVREDPQRHLKDLVQEDTVQSLKLKAAGVPRVTYDDVQQSADRDYNPKKSRKPEYEGVTGNLDVSDTTPGLALSLGKFTRPIVVPELPRYKVPPYTTDYPENQSSTVKNVLETEPTAPLEILKSKPLESNYLTTSSVVLNPLQAGVALVNAGQVNNINDPSRSQEHQEFGKQRLSSVNGNQEANETLPQENPEDQLLQQEQIQEVVKTSPIQSVEIQKSVEVYHTAPIQEIHYPPEFVPHVQNLVKQDPRGQVQKGQVGKDHRGQLNFNIYKSNEILEETIPVRPQQSPGNRYEYTVNEDDVNRVLPLTVYSATGVQGDQPDGSTQKPVFGVREHDDTLYEQSILQQTKVRGDDEAPGVKHYDYGKALGPREQHQVPRTQLVNLDLTKEPQFLFTKAVDGTDVKLLPIPQPYPVEKIIEKMVHVPHNVEVEKLIEKKVPYAVEKVIEKQVTIPQPYPVHIQVPVDRIVEKQVRIPQLYPIHIERVIEKKVPFPVQRYIIQPYPVHIKVPQAYGGEKPVHIQIPVEKVIEKTVHVPRPYAIEIEKTVDHRQYPHEAPKFIKTVHPFYNSQYDGSHQQSTRVQGYYQTNPQIEESHANVSQFYGPYYRAQNRGLHLRQPVHVASKKFGFHYPLGYVASPGYRHQEDSKDEYMGPVPRKQGNQFQEQGGAPAKRRTRQDTPVNTGSFRQSKMEYGFKPPMVPSVQYDEKTATKVE